MNVGYLHINKVLSRLILISIGFLLFTQSVQAQVIAKSNIDLIVESNSYVPETYQATPAVSAGSTMRVTAIGVSRNLVYNWSINGRLVNDLSGIGQTSIALQVTDQPQTVSLQVLSDGQLIDKAQVKVRPQPIELLLYQDHPTRGPLLQSSLPAIIRTTASALNLTAVPYGASEETPQVAWQINRASLGSELTISLPRFEGGQAGTVNATYTGNLFSRDSASVQVQFSIPQN